MSHWDDQLKIYDEIVDRCPRFERQGKTMPFTSANGYMFSLLNKEGELGIRFSKEDHKKYMEEWGSAQFRSYNSNMRGYVTVPNEMLQDLDAVAGYLDESYDYVMSLEPK